MKSSWNVLRKFERSQVVGSPATAYCSGRGAPRRRGRDLSDMRDDGRRADAQPTRSPVAANALWNRDDESTGAILRS